MIKAVFFDFYHTLITFDPPREELQIFTRLRKLDRNGFWEKVSDCPRIRSLAEIVNHL